MTDAKPLAPEELERLTVIVRRASLQFGEDAAIHTDAVERLLATIADKDKTITERDDEIRRLRQDKPCDACKRAGHKTKTTACGCSCHYHRCPKCDGEGRVKHD